MKGTSTAATAARLALRLVRPIRLGRSARAARGCSRRRDLVHELVRQIAPPTGLAECRVGAHDRVERPDAFDHDLVGALVEFGSADRARSHEHIVSPYAGRVTSRSTSQITPDGCPEERARPQPIVWGN